MLEEFHLSGVCVFYFDERGGAAHGPHGSEVIPESRGWSANDDDKQKAVATCELGTDLFIILLFTSRPLSTLFDIDLSPEFSP